MPVKSLLVTILLSCSGTNLHPVDKQALQEEINRIIAVNTADYVFKNVNVVSMVNENIESGMNVYVKNGLIERITHANEPVEAYTVIEGSGKYLMPGLADMHVHFITDSLYDHNNLFVMLANGVTRMRIMWGFRAHRRLRDQINQRQLLGPSIVVASAGFNGPTAIWPGTVTTTTTDQVRERVDAYHGLGYDFIKVYSFIPPDQYDALIESAGSLGIKPIGHLPVDVDFQYAMNHGQYSFEHLDGFLRSPIGSASYNSAVATSISKGTWHCPTLTVLMRTTSNVTTYVSDEYYSMISPAWVNYFRDALAQPLQGDAWPGHTVRKQYLKALHDAGVNIIGGTDAGIRYLIPGPSLHEELRYFVDAGLTNYQALKLVTVNASNFLNGNFGQVVAGKEADLVLLDKNPLENIAHAKEIAGTMKAGTWLSRENISKVKAKLKRVY